MNSVGKYDLTPIFRPKNMVVIGLSTKNSENPGNVIFVKNAREMKVKAFGVNPRADEIDRHKVYRSLSTLPEVPELAVIAVSAKNTLDVMKEIGQIGVKGAIVIGGGFAEIGEKGIQLQDQLVRIAEEYHVPFVGPNCIGVFSPPLIDTFFLPSERLIKPKSGNVAIVSQSGGVLVDQFFMNFSERNIGVSTAVSIGNKAMINEAQLMEYFENDPQTNVIAFYLEGFHPNDGRRFCEIARKSRKDVVVFSGGVTTAGKAAAGSHTGSLAADGAIMKGAFKQYSVINPPDEIFLKSTIKCYSSLANPYRRYSTMAIHGDRIAILSISGGHGVLCSDLLEKYNLSLAKLTEKQKEDIGFLLNPIAARIAGLNNPIDVTGSGTDEDLVNVLEYFLNADNVEMIIMLIVPQVPQISMSLGRKFLIGKQWHR